MATPGARDIEFTRGDGYSHIVTITSDGETPIDVSARSYASQIRVSTGGTDPAAEFDIDDTDAATGVLVLSLTAAQTADLVPGARYRWDLEETTATVPRTILTGAVTVLEDVTR